MAKLVIRLHYRCPSSNQKESQGGEISDTALLQGSQGSGASDGASQWKS